MIKAYTKKLKREREDNMSMAWLNAYFQRTKKLPDLESFLKKLEEKNKSVQTAQDMLSVVKALNAKFGGKVKKEG